ncbi:efflux RND transporter periplasmic adaptor subunit [Photobacterium sp. SDRW27]|uniref:efflux RND transporter periplasmic adaptor subunit n=1 Tax=Photobacterium obscurum TaxID=2829490 RepID=UPI0022435DCF|nr:efflux RND transporter periplasmic adaptor subunit [Photobacterium obscurum]MCW8329005.1 efflux RND transporter periplasmic adaptor subunit [Photobacterium obscurum]
MRITLIIGCILLAGLAAGIWYKEQARSQTASLSRGEKPSVVVALVVKQDVRREVEALGTVKSRESVVLSAKVTEKVDKVHFSDGQQVKAGELLVTLLSGEQKAKVRAAKANLKEHQREYKRIEGLVKRNTIASSELDKLFTDIEVARAVLAQNQAELEARFILAPFSGLLGFRQISPGALVTPGTVITTLDDLAKVKLDFTIPEQFIGELQLDSIIEGSVAAFPQQQFSGLVTSIDSRVDPLTRAIVVRAEIDNPQLLLRPGMLMTLSLIVEQREGLVVPEEALVPRQHNNYLFVVNSDSVVEQRRVEVGFRRRGEAEILSGVTEGERIIIRGIQRVRPGQAVETRQSERFSYQEAG